MDSSISATEFKFEINNFHLSLENCKLVESNIFTSPDKKSQWLLQAYPEGDCEDNFGYVSLYLILLACSMDHIEASFTFSIYIGDEICRKKSIKQQKFYNGSRFGFSRYIENSCLAWISKRFYSEGNISIHCELKITDVCLTTTNTNIAQEADSEVVKDLIEIFRNQNLSDVTLDVNGREFRAHKAILGARSPVFAAMFEHEMEEKLQGVVKISDMTAEAMEELLQFIYTGRPRNIKNLASDLLQAADKYCLEGLKLMCERELFRNLSDENVIQTLIIANMHNVDTLKYHCIKLIISHDTAVIDSQGMKGITDNEPLLLNDLLRARNNVNL